MLFEVLKDESGKFYAEKIDGWRNNPDCVKLLNVKSEAEAQEIARGMNAAPPQAENKTPPQAPDEAETPLLAESGATPAEPAPSKSGGKKKKTAEA